MNLFNNSFRSHLSLTRGIRRLHFYLNRWLWLDTWFPHLPLALAVGVLGLLRLTPAIQQTLGVSLLSNEVKTVIQGLMENTIRGIPQVIVGIFLLVMSVGLLWRSRLAWVTALLITSASLGLSVFRPDQPVRWTLTAYNSGLLVALLLAHRQFQRSSIAAGTLFALTSTMLLMSYAILGSYVLGKDFSPPIGDFISALYFAVVTMSTVGYGDITPHTPEARLFVISLILFGITVFATSLSAILVPIMNAQMQRLAQGRQPKMTRSGHYVIVGDTALARNSYQELSARGESVTFIFQHPPPDGGYAEADIVVGDGSDLEVLRRAGADRAKAILALGNDDSENAFVILAAKELDNSIKTVAVVNDSRNLKRIQRVHPDLVIAPQVLGGELLAMALSGEEVDSDKLLRHLLSMPVKGRK